MPRIKKLGILPKILSKKELITIKLLLLLIILSASVVGVRWYNKNSITVPASGGEYIEGIVGAPNLINPILSQANEADQDITRLLFNGLFKQVGSRLSPDLVESYSMSDDQLAYTFKLKKNITWHDGMPFTASDVAFTFNSIQNPEFKSPLYSSLVGLSVKQLDDQTIILTLPEPFAPFLSLLTFGIIPEHIWENIPPHTAALADFNLKAPIGTGPFKIKSLKKDSRGVIKSYTLIRNENFYQKPPYLETVTFKFYSDSSSAVEALNNKNIDGINYLPKKYHSEITNKNVSFNILSLPQYSAIFFNAQKNPILENIDIRKALTMATNRTELVEKILDNQGTAIYGPLLPGFLGYNPDIEKHEFNTEEAVRIIEKTGWTKITKEEYNILMIEAEDPDGKNASSINDDTEDESTSEEEGQEEAEDVSDIPEPPFNQDFFWQKDNVILTIVLTTVDNPETTLAALIIKKQWETIGVKVNLDIVSKEHLLTDVIKPRNYETLLFGQILGNDPDPYAFWHSSQINDPGLNLSLYTNKRVDSLLEDARKNTDPTERAKKYLEFQNILKDDIPAIFLYNPTYPYISNSQLKGFNIKRISIPADRFNGIEKWYLETKRQLQLKKGR